MKILVVDDSSFLRIANERALVHAGHKVISCADGEEGLRLAIEHKPDLIVLDMLLPKMTGVEVLRAVRSNPGIADVPVMVLSSLPQSNEDRLINDGATAYYEKSLLRLDKGTGHFVQEVERILRRAARQKAEAAAAAAK